MADATTQGRSFGGLAIGILVVVALVVALTTTRFASGLDPSSASAAIGPATVSDGIVAQATVSNVDPAKAEMTIRLAMDPAGSLDDNGLLAKPVTLYYVSVDGTKQIDFKAGKPLGTTDLAVPLLDGTISSYPWDQYKGDIELTFVTVGDTSATPAATAGTTSAPTTTAAPEATTEPTSAPSTSTTAPTGTTPPTTAAEGEPAAQLRSSLRVTTADTDPAAEKKTEAKPDTIVPAQITVFENVPAYNVLDISGAVDKDGVVQAHFEVRRAPAAIAFSVLVTVVMWVLALGVLLIALSVVLRRRKLELAQVTMMAAILFALPAALRGSQPGIPPPGVLADFYGFFFCALIVALSLGTIIGTYLFRKPD